MAGKETLHIDTIVYEILKEASQIALEHHNEYLHPEHILLAIFRNKDVFASIAMDFIDDLDGWDKILSEYIDDDIEKTDYKNFESDDSIEWSSQTEEVFIIASNNSYFAHQTKIDLPQVFNAIYLLTDSMAQACIENCFNTNFGNVLSSLICKCKEITTTTRKHFDDIKGVWDPNTKTFHYVVYTGEDDNDEITMDSNRFELFIDDDNEENDETTEPSNDASGKEPNEKGNAESFLTCLNNLTQKRNPLIGRETELERTIHILCRKDKNNVIFIGEPGVGKTALAYGLAEKINKGDVPEKISNCKIYDLNIGNLIAGTQFRGDFENRLKNAMEECLRNPGSIIYIDEIHNIVNAGATSGGSLDASNMLKPYLENGDLRFIGSTTYEDFNKHLSKDKALLRRFQQIDVKEPSIQEAIEIIKRLKKNYETFHGVKYSPDAIQFAVESSAKLIHNRHLPDKAIDLIDEAGAYASIHLKEKDKKPVVNKEIITTILQKICKVNAQALKKDEQNSKLLGDVEKCLYDNIYGQDQAIKQIMETILLAKSGLKEDDKPIASLLFVGPTGVGKTELCKMLSNSLNIPLVRFDMSEYMEKHAVAKLIGSPAGYVGYDDGGLLTSAINNTPNCVLLLDEIEKAHSDIFNILLQIMDYAQLTDNKGQKSSFQNVILIMTSNAGAQHAHLSNIGFGKKSSTGSAMIAEVKKTFKPEFINRLDDIVIFNDMDEKMASLVLDKNIRHLEEKLSKQKISLSFSDEAKKFLLDKGYSKEYGAREMERTVRSYLSNLLSKEILFGSLKKGGVAEVSLGNECLIVKKTEKPKKQ